MEKRSQRTTSTRSSTARFGATSSSPTDAARSAPSTWSATSLAWKTVPLHRFTAEAIVDTTVRLMKRRSLEHVAESDVLVALDLLNMTTSNLQHAEDHMLLLGRKTSLERVAAFLLEMDRRLTAAGVMALPMCRRDIADYLGLTLETVSRALSYLHGKGILGFLGQTQRQIVLLDRVPVGRTGPLGRVLDQDDDADEASKSPAYVP